MKTDRVTERLRTFEHLSSVPADDLGGTFNRRLRVVVDDDALRTRTGQLIALTTVNLAARLTGHLDISIGGVSVSGGVAVLLGAHVLDTQSLGDLARRIFPVTCTANPALPADVTVGIGAVGEVDLRVGVDDRGGAVVRRGARVEIESADAAIAALVAATIGIAQAAKLLYPVLGGVVDDVVRVADGPFGGPLDVSAPRIVGRPVVAGVGAIGSAFIYALIAAEARGELVLLDPDSVKDGNLARYVLFDERHLGRTKVDIAAELLREVGIDSEPHASTLADYLKEDTARRDRAGMVLSLVDSYDQRRSIAGELPREILNAGTADRDFTVSRHGFDDGRACLGCLYPTRALDVSRDAVIARELRMEVEAVRDLRLSKRPLGLGDLRGVAAAMGAEPRAYDEFVGDPLDSFYNRLCGMAALETTSAGEVFAPVPFVSALAGFMVAAGLLLPDGEDRYFRMDVFDGLKHASRRVLPSRSGCDICGLPALRDAYRARWHDLGRQL